MKVKSFAAALAVAAMAIASVGNLAAAATITQWTVELPTPIPADLNNSSTGPTVLSSAGIGTLSGSHASADTDWSTPAGPASSDSYSANTWAVGDYFQFASSTVGFENIKVSFDAMGSNTGPRDFKIAYSTDGSTFTDFGTYALVNASWSSLPTFVNPATAHFEFDLSAITALDDSAITTFRLIQTSTTAINGSPVATGGTSRVDNVTISGDVIVPEPATLALAAFGMTGVVAARRRS